MTVNSNSETMQVWGRGASIWGLGPSLAYKNHNNGSRAVQTQLMHGGRIVTLSKQRTAAGVVWSYIFHHDEQMHVYKSRVSLKEAMIGGLAMARAYSKVYDRRYKRIISPGGSFPSTHNMSNWDATDLGILNSFGFKREVTMTFHDGTHTYLYSTVMPSMD